MGFSMSSSSTAYPGSLNFAGTVSSKSALQRSRIIYSTVNDHPTPLFTPCLRANFWAAGVVLAPFFVHLELLFAFGYNPEMHKRINNEIGKEISKIRKAEGDKKRGAQATLVS